MAITPNYYETLYVTRPDLNEEDLAKIQQKLQGSISNNEGEIIKADKWADRELAYEIQDHKRGIYYILVFKALPEASKEVEKHLQFYRTDVLRFMTLNITEEAAIKHNKSKAEEAPKTETAPAAEAAETETKPSPVPEAPAAEPAPAEPESTQQAAADTTSTEEEGGTQ